MTLDEILKAQAATLKRAWARPHCADCGVFCRKTDYSDDEKYWTGRIVFRCDRCNERAADRAAERAYEG